MPNSIITPQKVAREALMVLENDTVFPKLVYRGYEDEFTSKQNGYKTGSQISIRRPTDFTLRTGRVMQTQDVVEGSVKLNLDQQIGVDFEFTSTQLTLEIGELGERVIKPAMVQVTNAIDSYIAGLYSSFPNWVGTPGQIINSFDDFAVGVERLDEFGVPKDDRNSVLSPSDKRGMLSQQTALYIQGPAGEAYRKGQLGEIDGVDTYSDQNIKTHTVGALGGTPLVNGANQVSVYTAVKDNMQQNLVTDGWTNSVTGLLKKGDVFTIAGVFAVNSVSKETRSFLRQFVVVNDVNSDGSGNATIVISPPIITSGAQQTVSAAPADNAAITVLGAANTSYRQSMMFHKNAIAFATVDMEPPQDGRKFARERYKGLSVRVIPGYDIINDVNKWRLDILFGAAVIDPRLGLRHSGTP